VVQAAEGDAGVETVGDEVEAVARAGGGELLFRIGGLEQRLEFGDGRDFVQDGSAVHDVGRPVGAGRGRELQGCWD